MKFIECRQGTPEWDAARCRRITASRFADAVSMVGGLTDQQKNYVSLIVDQHLAPKDAAAGAGYKALPTSDIVRRALAGERTEEFSDTARRYAADLSIERISTKPHGEPVKTWVMERGHVMEDAARRQYEARTGSFVTEAGICLTDDEVFGYSTDGLVDDDGLIEIKAPIDSVKILTMLATGDTSEYDHQIQGGMWITGRKWCDFIMYVPDLATVGKDLFVKRIFRDEGFITGMVASLVEFDGLVASNEAVLREGYVPPAAEEAQNEQQNIPEIISAPAVEDDSLIVDADFVEPAAELAAAKQSEEGAELSPAAQVLYEAEGAENFAAHHPKLAAVPTPAPTLRLGQICDRVGFTLTADFLLSLGFSPAARDKAARLYFEHDFPMICVALTRHISTVQAKQAA